MRGRSYSCLLVILFVILRPATLLAQSGRGDPAPDVSFPVFPPRLPLPPNTGPGLPLRPPGSPPSLPPTTIGPATISLTQLTQAAGMIFSGTVTGIARGPATRGQPVETVVITFHVDQAIRGVTPGDTLTISQWMGLWSSGQRYRIGDRLLLFLYAPSKLGLTSCVDAGLGRFAVDPRSNVLFSAQQLLMFRGDPVLGGKPQVSFSDFASAVRRAQPRPEGAE